jgi:hypothetical protein
LTNFPTTTLPTQTKAMRMNGNAISPFHPKKWFSAIAIPPAMARSKTMATRISLSMEVIGLPNKAALIIKGSSFEIVGPSISERWRRQLMLDRHAALCEGVIEK